MITINRPTELGAGQLVMNGCYCAVGWLAKELDISLYGEYYNPIRGQMEHGFCTDKVIDRLSEKLGIDRSDLSALVRDNDCTGYVEKRLDLFEQWCKEHDIGFH